MQKSNATYRTAIVSGLMLLLLLSSACSEPDGLAPEEVSRKFMEAVAKPDADEARKYVTFSSKLLVTVVIKLFTAAEEGSTEDSAKAGQLREKLKGLAANIRCNEVAEGAETVHCSFAANDSMAFPLVMTGEGWRLDLVQMIKEKDNKTAQDPTTADTDSSTF
ncbi:MAG: hypothetical protein KDK33_06860 [Leptospiraceae bacterium]|nr:hypothetical protein [Leptospiraceae bacterium]